MQTLEDRHQKAVDRLYKVIDALKNKHQERYVRRFDKPVFDEILEDLGLVLKHMTSFEMMFPIKEDDKRIKPVKDRKFLLMTGLGSQQADLLRWAKTYTQLDGMLDEEIRISWLLYDQLFLEPSAYSKRQWHLGIKGIMRAAGGFDEAITEGIENAARARSNGMTIATPNSVVNYVASARTHVLERKSGKSPNKTVTVL